MPKKNAEVNSSLINAAEQNPDFKTLMRNSIGNKLSDVNPKDQGDFYRLIERTETYGAWSPISQALIKIINGEKVTQNCQLIGASLIQVDEGSISVESLAETIAGVIERVNQDENLKQIITIRLQEIQKAQSKVGVRLSSQQNLFRDPNEAITIQELATFLIHPKFSAREPSRIGLTLFALLLRNTDLKVGIADFLNQGQILELAYNHWGEDQDSEQFLEIIKKCLLLGIKIQGETETRRNIVTSKFLSAQKIVQVIEYNKLPAMFENLVNNSFSADNLEEAVDQLGLSVVQNIALKDSAAQVNSYRVAHNVQFENLINQTFLEAGRSIEMRRLAWLLILSCAKDNNQFKNELVNFINRNSDNFLTMLSRDWNNASDGHFAAIYKNYVFKNILALMQKDSAFVDAFYNQNNEWVQPALRNFNLDVTPVLAEAARGGPLDQLKELLLNWLPNDEKQEEILNFEKSHKREIQGILNALLSGDRDSKSAGLTLLALCSSASLASLLTDAANRALFIAAVKEVQKVDRDVTRKIFKAAKESKEIEKNILEALAEDSANEGPLEQSLGYIFRQSMGNSFSTTESGLQGKIYRQLSNVVGNFNYDAGSISRKSHKTQGLARLFKKQGLLYRAIDPEKQANPSLIGRSVLLELFASLGLFAPKSVANKMGLKAPETPVWLRATGFMSFAALLIGMVIGITGSDQWFMLSFFAVTVSSFLHYYAHTYLDQTDKDQLDWNYLKGFCLLLWAMIAIPFFAGYMHWESLGAAFIPSIIISLILARLTIHTGNDYVAEKKALTKKGDEGSEPVLNPLTSRFAGQELPVFVKGLRNSSSYQQSRNVQQALQRITLFLTGRIIDNEAELTEMERRTLSYQTAREVEELAVVLEAVNSGRVQTEAEFKRAAGQIFFSAGENHAEKDDTAFTAVFDALSRAANNRWQPTMLEDRFVAAAKKTYAAGQSAIQILDNAGRTDYKTEVMEKDLVIVDITDLDVKTLETVKKAIAAGNALYFVNRNLGEDNVIRLADLRSALLRAGVNIKMMRGGEMLTGDFLNKENALIPAQVKNAVQLKLGRGTLPNIRLFVSTPSAVDLSAMNAAQVFIYLMGTGNELINLKPVSETLLQQMQQRKMIETQA